MDPSHRRIQKEARKAHRAALHSAPAAAAPLPPPPPPALPAAAAAALSLAQSWPLLYPLSALPAEPPSAGYDSSGDFALQDGTSPADGSTADAALSARLRSRAAFVLAKKRPQVRWLVARALELLARLPPSAAPPLVVDACGGRGGLGLALARALPRARVVVLDASLPAVEAGARAAAAAGLAHLSFLHASLPLPGGGAAAALREEVGGCGGGAPAPAPALLLGLHACGGLSDAILALARELRAAFCVVPCCFTKHGGVAGGAAAFGGGNAAALERLAESEHAALRRPAMRALNSARARQQEDWAQVELLAFPEELSAKNVALAGLPRA